MTKVGQGVVGSSHNITIIGCGQLKMTLKKTYKLSSIEVSNNPIMELKGLSSFLGLM